MFVEGLLAYISRVRVCLCMPLYVVWYVVCPLFPSRAAFSGAAGEGM